MNEPWQPSRSDRIRCCCRSLKLSSRGVAARCHAVRAKPFDAAAGEASRGALTAPHDAKRIGVRRRLAPARAAAAGLRRDLRRARGLEPRAPAALGAAADLRTPWGGGGGHRADLGTLLVDVPGSPP